MQKNRKIQRVASEKNYEQIDRRKDEGKTIRPQLIDEVDIEYSISP